MSIIKIEGIEKKYGKKTALQGVSTEFATGRIYGLLGRNGAGKSTLINIISNRVTANAGKVTLDGKQIKENDKLLGKIYAMSEAVTMPTGLKFAQAMKITKDFYPDFDMKYAQTLADKFGLDVKKRLASLSTGYLTISKISLALSSCAEFIFLDEPILGLDANHRELFYALMVERFSETDCCMVVSTHLIDECANLFEHVVIIDEGKIIADDEAESFLNDGYSVTGSAKLVDLYCEDKEIIAQNTIGTIKSAYIKGNCGNIPKGLEVSKPTLQQVFINLTGGQEGTK